jgi:RND family efflux transporter MFP subunit
MADEVEIVTGRTVPRRMQRILMIKNQKKSQAHQLHFSMRLATTLLVVVLLAGCSSSNKAEAGSASEGPVAPVVKVERRDISNDLQIASEFLPYQEIDVYAKVSGYVQKLYVDWGSHVHQGQLMAVLEIPELQQQIQQDQASVERASQDLNQAQSSYTVAHITYQRLSDVQKTRPELVAQQDIDIASGKDLEASAGVSAARQTLLAAQATLAKDRALYSYARMTAPFGGVVTQMYAYTGALLPAGTSSNIGNSALCHLSQNDLLRLVIPVPERAVPDIHVGQSVAVSVSSLNRMFSGKIVRFADQIDLATRTMHTEVSVPNPKYELVPGMYASVEIPLHSESNVLALPVQAVEPSGTGEGTVLLVDTNNRIETRQIKLGLQTANDFEVLSGLKEGDAVIFGEQNQYKAGQTVSPKLVEVSGSE